jgi:hypothetical protein
VCVKGKQRGRGKGLGFATSCGDLTSLSLPPPLTLVYSLVHLSHGYRPLYCRPGSACCGHRVSCSARNEQGLPVALAADSARVHGLRALSARPRTFLHQPSPTRDLGRRSRWRCRWRYVMCGSTMPVYSTTSRWRGVSPCGVCERAKYSCQENQRSIRRMLSFLLCIFTALNLLPDRGHPL